MTEAEWLVTTNVQEMYWWIRPDLAKFWDHLPLMTRRLSSLYAVACVRATPRAEGQPFLVRAMEVVEHAADAGNWDEVDRLSLEAHRLCGEAYNDSGEDSVQHCWTLAALRLTEKGIDQYAQHVPFFMGKALKRFRRLPQLRKIYADLLRDIAGNPFRGGRGCQFNKRKRKPQREPIFRPEWRTDTVVMLARTMYDTRDFSGMPILADALQEAGCEQPIILEHCRDLKQQHVRGCWVVDLILGKS
jgi:hypothetical protein